MANSSNKYSFTRIFLIVISWALAITGAILIFQMAGVIESTMVYLNNYYEQIRYSGSYSDSSNWGNLLIYSKFYIWATLLYLLLFWLSLISLTSLLSTILVKKQNNGNEVLLNICSAFLIAYSLITLFFYIAFTDQLSNIEWIRNFRLAIGIGFLIFNCLHGFICIAVAQIHRNGCEDALEIEQLEKEIEEANSSIKLAEIQNQRLKSDMQKLTKESNNSLFCESCGVANNSKDVFCCNCGEKL